ncbi:hypothetical protein [Paraburkholderia sp. BR10954]|uniref:hypothetical protein n=1 Tax=Paraburkholderia sp. BR10954 TaxID=3236995 RepID=UPI0034D1AF69
MIKVASRSEGPAAASSQPGRWLMATALSHQRESGSSLSDVMSMRKRLIASHETLNCLVNADSPVMFPVSPGTLLRVQ